MNEARAERAKNRIEDALTRIERAAAGAPAAAEDGWKAHHTLKAQARGALDELDKLIAELEG